MMQRGDNCENKPHEKLRKEEIELERLVFDGSRKYFFLCIKKSVIGLFFSNTGSVGMENMSGKTVLPSHVLFYIMN